MLEALAAAILLGGINTIADFASAELKLQARPIYAFARIMIICYCVGGIVGARARQLIIGTLGGLMIGAMVAAAYYALQPVIGWQAVPVAWTLFWIGFSVLDAIFRQGSGIVTGILQGAAAAALSGGLFYFLTNIWTETPSRDVNLWRVMALWAGAFFPGFIVLFWHKL